MNDEIKEILDLLKYCVEKNEYLEVPNMKEWKPLLDYIINLQQLEQEHKKINGELREENSKLEIALQNIQEDYDKRIEENERLKVNCNLGYEELKVARDYKSRCEKAIDKIQYIIDYGFDYDGFNTVESLKDLIDMLVDYARESKNILQNGSENDG
jgi:hypothetical protein